MENNEPELKNQYDSIRNLMKLNYNLRTKLINNTKIARQLLNSTLKSKDILMKRLDIASKDHQSDGMPTKLYDFIAQEKIH